MADEYFLQQPLIEKAMRGYTVQQKPVFQLMWALLQIHVLSAETTFWSNTQLAGSTTFLSRSISGWAGEGPIRKDYSWDPTATPIMRKIFEDFWHSRQHTCTPFAAGADDGVGLCALGTEADCIERRCRGSNPCPVRREISRNAARNGGIRGGGAVVLYFEEFKKPRELAIWSDASITGFAHLKWDSSPVQLCPWWRARLKQPSATASRVPQDRQGSYARHRNHRCRSPAR